MHAKYSNFNSSSPRSLLFCYDQPIPNSTMFLKCFCLWVQLGKINTFASDSCFSALNASFGEVCCLIKSDFISKIRKFHKFNNLYGYIYKKIKNLRKNDVSFIHELHKTSNIYKHSIFARGNEIARRHFCTSRHFCTETFLHGWNFFF